MDDSLIAGFMPIDLKNRAIKGQHCALIKIFFRNSMTNINEPPHEISNNVACATSKGSDQPAHTHSLIRAFASR